MFDFEGMWSLIVQVHENQPGHFTPELFACLFWEESGYRLVAHPHTRALGFGQVLPSVLAAVNRRFNTTFTPAALMSSPEQSARAGMLAMEVAWDWKKDATRALFGYAGMGTQSRSAVGKWLAGEAELKRLTLSHDDNSRMKDPAVRARIVGALRLCSQPGYDPAVLFK